MHSRYDRHEPPPSPPGARRDAERHDHHLLGHRQPDATRRQSAICRSRRRKSPPRRSTPPQAGASILHLHVRHAGWASIDGARSLSGVVRPIRDKNDEVILNITTGPGGRFQPGEDDPKVAGPRTNFVTAEQRVAHIPVAPAGDLHARPQHHDVRQRDRDQHAALCAQDGRNHLRLRRAAGVRTVRQRRHRLLNDFLASGAFRGPPLASLVLGVKYGFAASPETMLYARNLLPARCDLDRVSASDAPPIPC